VLKALSLSIAAVGSLATLGHAWVSPHGVGKALGSLAGSPATRFKWHLGAASATAETTLVGGQALQENEPAGKSIIVVSDSTGQTAAALTERLLVQFKGIATTASVTIVPEVKTVEQISEVVREAEKRDALVMATLVDSTMASWAKSLCDDGRVRFVDVMTPLIDEFSRFLEEAPAGVPGGATSVSPRKVSKMVNREFFGMIEAVKFGQRHVAGLNPQDWQQADLVLIGPSRVGKGPIAHYLAQRGVKAASLNTSPDDILPLELSTIEPHKVALLVTGEERLVQLRRSRIREAQVRNMPSLLDEDYATPERVREELDFLLELKRQHPDWEEMLDITYLSVEEGASALFRRVAAARRRNDDR